MSHFSSYSIPSRQKTTTAGFEPTLPKGNCLAGNRLNHSATLSSTLLLIHHRVPLFLPYTTSTLTIPTIQNFLKKRQWQDLNLRIQRIIDFKSIALDHSATLSSTSISPYTLLVSADIPDYLHIYLHIPTCICLSITSTPTAFTFPSLPTAALIYLPLPFIQ